MTGLLFIDKPVGMTSHDVVDRVRRAAGLRRVGHTGTLDPGATGLLIICLGPATRLSEHLTGLDKVYEGYMRLGTVTDSYDLDGKVVEQNLVPELTVGQIQEVCDEFTGEILQVPPMVSAVKVGGERLYKKARQGEVVEREPRRVTVREFKVLDYEKPDASIRVCCTRGTYVRSLCHDVGQRLGCRGALAGLRRTSIGRFSVEDAVPVDALATLDDVREHLHSIDNALDLPEIVVHPRSSASVCSGAPIAPANLIGGCPMRSGWVQIKLPSGRLMALGEVRQGPAGVWVHPRRVFVD